MAADEPCVVQKRGPSTTDTLSGVYMRALARRPLATKAVSGFCLGAMSNMVASFQQTGRIDVLRAMRYGMLNSPPYSHFWFPFLDSLTSKSVVKLVIDQLVYRPVMIAYSLCGVGLMQGHSRRRIAETLRASYLKVGIDNLACGYQSRVCVCIDGARVQFVAR